jgi:hypothetical protein
LEVSSDPSPLTLETVASFCPYSPECVEGEFYEVHLQDPA